MSIEIPKWWQIYTLRWYWFRVHKYRDAKYTTTFSGTDVVVTDDGRDLFSWDIKGGVTYSLNETTDLYGEVVYLQTDSFDEDGINYDAITSTNLMAGIKFNF